MQHPIYKFNMLYRPIGRPNADEEEIRPLVEALIGRNPDPKPMILDTGSHRTVLPMKWIDELELDHPNRTGNGPALLTGVGDGLQRECDSFKHTETITFIDAKGRKWKSAAVHVIFSEKMDQFPFGLIGMNMIAKCWSQFICDTASYDPARWTFSFIPREAPDKTVKS